MNWKRGVTREVLLVGCYAVKMPSLRSWTLFLQGLLANMQERDWSGFHPILCPVIRSLPGGWLIVMRRAAPAPPLTKTELSNVIADAGVPVEPKQSSFGTIDGRLVAVDYGS